MKLIRRKRKPTPAQKALDILRTVFRGLAAVRVARTAFKTYKIARHLPQLGLLVAIGGAVFAVVRRLKQRGAGPETETWSPSAATPSPAAGTPSPASAASNGAPVSAPVAAADPDPSPEPELHANPAETAATGTPPVELAEAGEPPHVEPADDLPAAGTADAPVPGADPADAGDRAAAGTETAVPGTDVPELDTEVATDAVPAPDAEPGPADRA
jgi:hypothetical protein